MYVNKGKGKGRKGKGWKRKMENCPKRPAGYIIKGKPWKNCPAGIKKKGRPPKV